ncbi:hypothetical protein SFRURICE_016392 [Spodoptera frugiperda]|nr:hypothetical protein SFRURICE_016392 [Spodoptera frugiperda]
MIDVSRQITFRSTPHYNNCTVGAMAGQLVAAQHIGIGFGSLTEQLFVLSTNCCFGSEYHVYVNLYVYKRTYDTGENPRVGQHFVKNNILDKIGAYSINSEK